MIHQKLISLARHSGFSCAPLKRNSLLLIATIWFSYGSIALAANRYVDPASLSPTPPYTSWTTAAHTIPDALGVCTSGDVVIVANGVYTLVSQLIVPGGVSLTSVSGAPNNATINGNGVTRCVYMAGVGSRLSGFTVTGGMTDTYGAGVYCVGGTVTNCAITNNQAVGDAPQGGGVYCDGGTVSHCVVSGNSVTSTNTYYYGAFAEGGGIYAVDQSHIDHSTVTNNTLTGYYANGAGINANNGSLQNCTISGNTAYGHWYAFGGGVYMTANAGGLVRNCLISGNNAHTDHGGTNWASGGGVYFNSGGTLESSTVSGNTVDGDISNGGGFTYGDQIRNTIIYGNNAATDPNYYLNPYAPATFDHCDSTPLPPGTGNIASNPGFASGYHLAAGSPCIDTGINEAWMSTATDLDGNRRIWNSTVDMGALEFGSVPPVSPRYDFNADSHPDYVLYNAGTRQTALWYLNNSVYIGGAYAPTVPAGWTVTDVADFIGDGHPDYALFNPSTRQTAIWYLNNNVYIGGAYGPTLPSGWALVAIGDFNGDGKPDYALYNGSSRQTAIWYMNNNVYVTGTYGPTLPFGWNLVGVADFNTDGKVDYLLFNASTRQSAIWYLNNNVYVSGAYGPTIASGYVLRGTADFNGDGKPDYLLYNPSTQRTAIWYLNNNVYVSGVYGPTLPAGWTVAAP